MWENLGLQKSNRRRRLKNFIVVTGIAGNHHIVAINVIREVYKLDERIIINIGPGPDDYVECKESVMEIAGFIESAEKENTDCILK